MSEAPAHAFPLETWVVQDAGGLDGLRESWVAFQRHPQADFEHFARRVADPQDGEPYVIAVGEGGRALALLAALRLPLPYPCRIGYTTLARPVARSLDVVEGGVMGELTPESAACLFDALERALREGVAEIVHFQCLPQTSPLQALVRNRPPSWRRDHAAEVRARYRLRLPGSFEEFTAGCSSNTRSTIRRTRKRIEKALAGRLQIRRYQRPEDADAVLRAIARVSADTYQVRLGVGYEPSDRAGKLDGLARGRLRVWVLEVDGEPRAFWDGVLYQGSWSIWHTGFDEKLAELRPGLYLLLAAIEALCGDPEVSEIDFGSQAAQYKRSLANQMDEEAEICLYGPTFRAVAIANARGVAATFDRLFKRLLARLGIEQRVKRWFRRG